MLQVACFGQNRHVSIFECNTMELFGVIAYSPAFANLMNRSAITRNYGRVVSAYDGDGDAHRSFITAHWGNARNSKRCQPVPKARRAIYRAISYQSCKDLKLSTFPKQLRP